MAGWAAYSDIKANSAWLKLKLGLSLAKNIVPHGSIPSVSSATSDRNATDENTFMSETRFKDVKDKNSNKLKQKQDDKNVKPDKGYHLTDNGTVPTPAHSSEESETYLRNMGSDWQKTLGKGER